MLRSDALKTGVFTDSSDYLIVRKITASASGNDKIEASAFSASGSVPTSEPASYDVSSTFTSSVIVNRMGMGQSNATGFGSNPGNNGTTAGTAEWDEFLIGGNWGVVTGNADPYLVWKDTHFGSRTAPDAADTADPD